MSDLSSQQNNVLKTIGMGAEILTPDRCNVLIIDLQTRLVQKIISYQQAFGHIEAVAKAVDLWDVPCIVTQHCPDKIGQTDPDVQRVMPPYADFMDKSAFGALLEPTIFQKMASLKQQGRDKSIIIGAEAHICVLQTVLQLIACGITPYILVQAVISRHGMDQQIALQRMQQAGARLVTTDMVLYEWCQDAGMPQFKKLLPYIKKLTT